jgi:hypothetical protein
MTTISNKVWQTTLIDAGDGSGDAILIFPDELMTLIGWVEGDVLSLEAVDRSIKVTKNSNNL